MTVSNLAATEDLLTPLLLAAVDDTNDAPWMTMPEFQFYLIQLLVGILRLHTRRHRLGWHVAGELSVSTPKPEGQGTLTLGPDLIVVEADSGLRTSWDTRSEGQPPRFVLEVATADSAVRDTTEKPSYYQAMGVEEYAIYWPYRADGGPRLFGYHRDEAGHWAPWRADEQDVLWSRALGGLGLAVAALPWLKVVDQHGHALPSLDDEAERAEREAERATRLEAEVARLRAKLEGQADQPRRWQSLSRDTAPV